MLSPSDFSNHFEFTNTPSFVLFPAWATAKPSALHFSHLGLLILISENAAFSAFPFVEGNGKLISLDMMFLFRLSVCQPILLGFVFWQVNMRLSKYFSLLSVSHSFLFSKICFLILLVAKYLLLILGSLLWVLALRHSKDDNKLVMELKRL